MLTSVAGVELAKYWTCGLVTISEAVFQLCCSHDTIDILSLNGTC